MSITEAIAEHSDLTGRSKTIGDARRFQLMGRILKLLTKIAQQQPSMLKVSPGKYEHNLNFLKTSG